MSIFDSLSEIDAHIAKAKEGLLKLSSGVQEYTLEAGSFKRTFRRSEIKELREHLSWLRNERAAMVPNSRRVVLHGRPSR